ncbi:MAG: lipid hydroperoxide peroxidase [Elusimicrobia bacterium RIFOXYA2_FULL_58_8]|nr:MAG: lipid hydroperoxide peroxidase [Elusimicrobia bacterium RIFOXYA12_FULL_57_11]OGS15367.1 MAG: lipid hydroperoxide peroxidase [Elusimicrobia bacterium RIFOXYA2_FULL_58_8]
MEEKLNEEIKKEVIKRTITMKGRPMVLVGEEVKVGMTAPDFKATGNDMLPMKFARSFAGKITVISSVPSLDTAVCDLQTRRFNKEAELLGPDVQVITISMDLPFAQARWCGAAGVKAVRTFSDYQKAEFGKAWGLLIKDLRLLARAVYIVDKDGIVKYAQLVPEVAQEPNYDEVLTALKALV